MYLEFVKWRFRKKRLEKKKECICKEGLQGSSGFGRADLLKKMQLLQGEKRYCQDYWLYNKSVYGRKTVFLCDFHIHKNHLSSH